MLDLGDGAICISTLKTDAIPFISSSQLKESMESFVFQNDFSIINLWGL